ncbi:MAG: hypothetical protein U0S50_10435 [Sphingopyxis sp.]|uniref:hypothetical protein n=1 Tax=Sphingopyxis sp. TaxID=1908224 RepID=UPI002ABA90E5|nr:hypothetical protein [Sphingopyxis sp.]MDZ3832222.1 hypothetical protein [Sphingopyxis sp.]
MIARIQALMANHYLCCITLAALTLIAAFLLILTLLLLAAIRVLRWIDDSAPAWTLPSAAAMATTILLVIIARIRRTRRTARYQPFVLEPSAPGSLEQFTPLGDCRRPAVRSGPQEHPDRECDREFS